ncbi:MAG: EamA family transporter [Mucispirillum sp.]|nr:EamA family transporter [Mucispirillum sp.]
MEKGDINKVTPVDKSSTAFTIILAVIFLKENITFLKTVWIIFIACGSYMMARNKGKEESSNHIWLIYALLSMIFASLTTIFGKIGIDGVDSGLGNAIRTGIVLIMAWIIVIIKKKLHLIKECFNKEILFIVLSGITAGASWVCFYKGLQIGVTSAVAAIDKLSIVITIIFSYIVFKEKLTFSGFLGLAMIIAGTIGLINI